MEWVGVNMRESSRQKEQYLRRSGGETDTPCEKTSPCLHILTFYLMQIRCCNGSCLPLSSECWTQCLTLTRRSVNVYVCVCTHAQSCLTLCNLMDCSLTGSSVRGISQARILGWVATLSSRGSSWPRDKTCISCVSCIGRRILHHWATWEALNISVGLSSSETSVVLLDYVQCLWRFTGSSGALWRVN